MSSSSAPSGTVAPAISPGLDALLHHAALAPIQNVGWLRVTGSDRVRWLNGMVTNNIAALQPGQGNYNFFLNAQGRIQADATAWMLDDFILLETAADRLPALIAMLDHFIIMDDVELAPIDSRAGLLLAGPSAAEALAFCLSSRSEAKGSAVALPSPLSLTSFNWSDEPVDLLHAGGPIVPHYELWSHPATIASISSFLATAIPATPADLETLRILSGIPLYGTDIRNSETAKDLPQETNQTRALHFAKGCYLGQEIVERIRSRGAVHRTFTGFLLTGDPPHPGTQLTDDIGKPVGELTSVTAINSKLLTLNSKLSDISSPAALTQTIALGYIRREALERPGARIQYPSGTATPVTLPFSISHAETSPENHVR